MIGSNTAAPGHAFQSNQPVKPAIDYLQRRVQLWATLFTVVLLFEFVPLFSAIVSGRLGTGQDANDASGSLGLELFSVAAFLGSIVVARLSKVSLQQFLLAMMPVALMLLWIFTSIAWSNFPDLTAKRAARLTIETGTAVLLALSTPSQSSALRVMFRTFCFITILDLMSWFFPTVSQTPIGFAGIHIHKNGAGEFFFLSIPIIGLGITNHFITRFRTIAVVSFLAASTMLLLTLSKSALGILMISLGLVALMHILNKLHQSNRVVLATICVLGASCIAILVMGYGLDETLDLLYGDATLTGRDQIWRFLWFLAEKSPLLGVGYGALWQTGPQIESLVEYTGATWVPNEGHNGYLDILAQVGLVGIACLLVFLSVSFNRLTRYMRIPENKASAGYKEYALYVFFGVLIYNITESSLFRPGQEVWFMLVYLTTSASLALRRNSLGRDATP